MSGFEAWAATFPATCIVAGCTLVLGLLTGWLAGTAPRRPGRRARRRLMDLAADRAGARAAGEFRAMRVPELHHEAPHWRQVDHQRQGKTSIAAFLDPPPGYARASLFLPPLPGELEAQDAWRAHEKQALALANGDPITTGEIRAITEGMDVFMARLLGEHPVPWPDGERSGQ